MSQISINRKNRFRDFTNGIFFLAAVVCGTLLMNAFVFRSYSIEGGSMEPTLHQSDRVIVNRLPVTWSQIKNSDYIPERGQVIVFENPQHASRQQDRYLIKRVIGLPGDRVTIKNNKITIINSDNPNGFNPDANLRDKMIDTINGEIDDMLVKEKHLFVVGDHRDGNNSRDSRNGLGQVPLHNVIGPVSLRLLPINSFRTF